MDCQQRSKDKFISHIRFWKVELGTGFLYEISSSPVIGRTELLSGSALSQVPLYFNVTEH